MERIFFKCKKLKSIDLSDFDTSKVTNMLGMFTDCLDLETINLRNINTSSAVTMRLYLIIVLN